MNITKLSKEKLIVLHKWNQKRWLVISLALATVSAWFPLILNFWGQDLNLISVSKNKRIFTRLGLTLTIIIVLFSLVLTLAQRCYEFEEINNNKDKVKLEVLEVINESTDDLYDRKYNTLLKQLYNIKNNKVGMYHIVTNPEEQLVQIIQYLNKSLCKILSYEDYKINNNEMYVCLHYNFPKENREWHLAESLYPERNISTTELIKSDSTFKEILSSKKSLIFCNSKEDARKHNKYIPDEEDQYDENHNLKGSIACYKIQVISHGITYINAIISFVTYSKKFINTDGMNEEDKNKAIDTVKYNIKTTILSEFKKIINIELSLLYILNLNEIQQDQHEDKNASLNMMSKAKTG